MSDVAALLQTPESVEDAPAVKVERGTVLLVEDDPANREVLVDLLALWDYDVIPVGSSEEAEYAIRTKTIRAAIVDIFLPGKSGAQLLSKLRERYPDAILIGVSGLSDASMARALKGVGADAFIGKPISAERLAEVLAGPRVHWH